MMILMTKGGRVGQPNAAISGKGGRGLNHLLTITDKDEGKVHTPSNLTDIFCEQSLAKVTSMNC